MTNELATKRGEIKSKQAEVQQLKSELVQSSIDRMALTPVQLEKTEARSKDDLEKKKQTRMYSCSRTTCLTSALFTYLLSQKLALTRLRSRTTRLQSELDTLHNILAELKKGYNPNGQDMAVKAAVVGYEEFLKGDDPASNIVSTSPAEPTSDASDSLEAEAKTPDLDVEEEISDRELDEIDRKDLDGLLLSEAFEEDEEEDEGDSMRKWFNQVASMQKN